MKKKRNTEPWTIANPAVRTSALSRRKSTMPLTATGVGSGQLVTIPPESLDALVIGDYQRKEERVLVNDIMHAMMNGGEVVDPGTLGKRPDGTLVILDGQQRWWAHKRLARPWRVIKIDVPTIEMEMAVFNILNTRREVGANYRVNSWPGEAAEMLRRLNAKVDGPLYQQIDLGGHSARPLSATILIRTMAAVSTTAGNGWRGNINTVLRYTDWAMANAPNARERSGAVVHLMVRVFPGDGDETRLRYLPAIGLALVCREKWDHHTRIISPTPSEIRALSRIRWVQANIGMAENHLPSVTAMIRRRWKSA